MIFWNTRWSLVFVLLWWKRTEIRNDLTIKLVHNKKILCQEIVYHLFYSINLKLNLDGFEFNSRNIWFILPIKSLRFFLTFILNRREGCCIQSVARLDNKFLWTFELCIFAVYCIVTVNTFAVIVDSGSIFNRLSLVL